MWQEERVGTVTRASHTHERHNSHPHKVVYVPNSAFVGEDDFEYTVYSGAIRSANIGKVGVHTSVCRVSDCEYARLEYEGAN